MAMYAGFNTDRCCQAVQAVQPAHQQPAAHLVLHHVCIVEVQHAPRQHPVPVGHHPVVGIHVVGNVCRAAGVGAW